MADLCPPEVAAVLRDPNEYIRRSDLEFEMATQGTQPIKVYWDRNLAGDRSLRIWFVKELARLGLVSFRRRIRARVGIFFVLKKDGRYRLVLDARETNRTHRSPPHCALGTPGALAHQDWSSTAIAAAEGCEVDDIKDLEIL
eukprot:1015810-Karenia_brevis.AAC.1